HDMKRVTVVVTWTDEFGRTPVSQSQSSLFTDGTIAYKAPTLNNPPTVSCPIATVSGLTVDFTAVASDSDGSIASVSWNFGDSTTGTGSTISHTYSSAGTYSITNTVVDNGGGSATNASLACTVTTTDPSAGNAWPSASISIANGATYTNTTIVTLNLSKGSGSSPAYMKFSNDGSTWSSLVAYSTTASWTLVPGDGTKTVYALFYTPSQTEYSAAPPDTIILATPAPGPPTALHIASSSISGSNKTLSLAWTAPTGVTDLGGYRLYRRI